MTVFNKIASAAVDPANPKQQPIPAEVAQGHVKLLVSTVEQPVADATSTINFGSVPSNARLIKGLSRLDFDGITGATDSDLGIGKTVGGVYTPQSADCLVNGKDIHTAGTSDALAAVDIANLGKAAWELAGYANDPGGRLDIVMTHNNAPTLAGTVTLTLGFATP